MDDATRVNLLGGMARQAAVAKGLRARQIDAAVNGAEGVASQVPPPSMPQAGAPMQQADFSGYGRAVRPDVALRRQQQLAAMLRARAASAGQ